jgi:hypothetical protein
VPGESGPVHGEPGPTMGGKPVTDVVAVHLAQQMSAQYGETDRQSQLVGITQDGCHAFAVIPVDGRYQGDDIASVVARRAPGVWRAVGIHGPPSCQFLPARARPARKAFHLG